MLDQRVRLLDQACAARAPEPEAVACRLRAVRETVLHLTQYLSIHLSPVELDSAGTAEEPRQPPATPSPAHPPDPAGVATSPAGRSSASRARQTVQIELRPAHLLAMHETGALDVSEMHDRIRVQKVLQAILDRWSGLRAAAARNSPAGRPAGDLERRRGQDRRQSGPRPNTLLSYVAGSAFDRRLGRDRRSAAVQNEGAPDGRTGAGKPAPGGPHPRTSPKNVVRMTGAIGRRVAAARRPPEAGLADVVSFPLPGPAAPVASSASMEQVQGEESERGSDHRK
jgi:hypothetical protein